MLTSSFVTNCCINMALWTAVACYVLIKSTVVHHTSTAQETATSCPDDDDDDD